jgi:hypothetical protein
MIKLRLADKIPVAVSEGGRKMRNRKEKLAIIVPYRDRSYNLIHFLLNIHWYLAKCGLKNDIYVIEQADSHPFNRGQVLNIGFLEAVATGGYSHFALHDVDLIPLSVDYSRPASPTHLGSHLGQFLYKLPYKNFFGGANLFTAGDFELINGFPNQLWGWGFEDDALFQRCISRGLKVVRRPGRFISLPHEINPDSMRTRKTNSKIALQTLQEDVPREGLSTVDYRICSRDRIQEFDFSQGKIVQLKAPVRWLSVKLARSDSGYQTGKVTQKTKVA